MVLRIKLGNAGSGKEHRTLYLGNGMMRDSDVCPSISGMTRSLHAETPKEDVFKILRSLKERSGVPRFCESLGPLRTSRTVLSAREYK